MLRRYPLFLLLLPVFFVEHGFMENYAFIQAKDALLLLLSYFGLAIVVYAVSVLLTRSNKKAALVTALFLCLYFFFGALHDFLKGHAASKSLSRYSISLTFCLAAAVYAYFFIRKKQARIEKFTVYLNTLLLIFVLVDAVQIVIKATTRDTSAYSVNKNPGGNSYYKCDTCKKPNIYFLLFDEYASSLSLQQRYNFHNDLDTFLIAEKFRVIAKSRSNYDFTPFSIASILNMSYLKGIRDVHSIDAEDYARCNALIRDCEVVRFLKLQGYDIVNYSIFDLEGNPTLVNESFLPIKTNLISDRTLYSKLMKDVAWIVQTKISFLMPDPLKDYIGNNTKFLSLLNQRVREKWNSPSFIYAHLDMPHPPYYYDSNGHRKDRKTVYEEYFTNPVSGYLGYVRYVNGQIRQVIGNIKQNDPTAVIVLMGDHGFRKIDREDPTFNYLFENLNAVYVPGNMQLHLSDSTTGVNQFRILFNDLFSQRLPLLKDSTIHLLDKK